MKINWKVRVKNRMFWLTVIPALLLVAQVVLDPFGITVPTDIISEQVAGIVNAIFSLLVILGIVTDPTTEGASDSTKALYYQKPKKDGY